MESKEMSSEVEEKQELTVEATDTEEEKTSPVEDEPTVPLHAHTALRGRAQKAEIEAAELRGKVSVLQSQQIETTTVSPLDTAKAAYIKENGDLDGFTLSAELYEQQEAYKAHQATKTAEGEAAITLANQQATSIHASKLVHDDWQEVLDAGEKLLTRGEHLDITSSGEKFGELAYAKCKAAIERSKPVKETSAAPETKTSEQEAKAKKKADEEAPSQADILANASPAAAAAFKL